MRDIKVERLVLGPLGTNCWLVSDGAGGPMVVIDPADDADVLLDAIDGHDVIAVVLTHAHFDHLGAAAAIMEATGAPLLAHALDAEAVTDAWANGGGQFGFDRVAPPVSRTLADGDVIEAGALRLKVLHTPGHTPGGICLFIRAAKPGGGDPHLFSGDTLFESSVGRTDLAGGDARALARSISAKLSPLPSRTRVHPGHGADTTIDDEARRNPFWPRTRL